MSNQQVPSLDPFGADKELSRLIDKIIGVAFTDRAIARVVCAWPREELEHYSTILRLLSTHGAGHFNRDTFCLALDSEGVSPKSKAAQVSIYNRCNMAAQTLKADDVEGIIEHLSKRLYREYAHRHVMKALDEAHKTMKVNPIAALETLCDHIVEIRPRRSVYQPKAIGLSQLLHADIEQNRVLIEGLLRIGELMNMIAGPKSRKSWLMLDLATSLATGGLWMGKLQCEQSKILLIDNELKLPTLRQRCQAVCVAKGIEVSDDLLILSVRGSQFDLNDVRSYLKRLKPDVVILDALYRFFPEGFDENSNAQMTRLYNDLDAIATECECAMILVHHSSKGIQVGKAIADVGAGAGAQSRAADVHVVLRPHKAEADQAIECAATLDAINRSFAPIGKTEIEWKYPLWRVTDKAAYQPDDISPEDFVNSYYSEQWQLAMRIRERALKDGVSRRVFDDLKEAAETKGLIECQEEGTKRLYRKAKEDAPF